MLAAGAAWFVTSTVQPAGIAQFNATSIGLPGADPESADTTGNVTSCTRNVSVPPVVAPLVLLERNTRPTVAVVFVAAAVATALKRTFVTNEPFVPAVNALKMSVPIVPVPSDFVFAAEGAIPETFGTSVKIGEVFAAKEV